MALIPLLDRILEHPWVYKTWQAPIVAEKFAPAERHLAKTTIRRVLDVGCGPGTNAARFEQSEYVGIDINERYLEVARAKYSGRFIQADLATADLSALGQFDTILVNSFLHHLPDDAVNSILRQLRSLLEPTGRVHILELVLPDKMSMATVMARLDRGRFPRSIDSWLVQFERHFDAAVVEPYQFGRGLWAMLYFQGKTRA